MKEIICYQTDDGATFNTEEEALKHEGLANFAIWYKNNKLYGNYSEGCTVPWSEFLEWANEHKNELATLVQYLS